jgi:transcription termination factor Rho
MPDKETTQEENSNPQATEASPESHADAGGEIRGENGAPKKIRLHKAKVENGAPLFEKVAEDRRPAPAQVAPPRWAPQPATGEGPARLHISDLNKKGIEDLMALAKDLGVTLDEEVSKQKLIFQILERSMSNHEVSIWATGVLEKMSEGYGFLRSHDFSYMPGSDDIYISPSQLRVYGLRTGDTVTGEIRPPKPQEKYFAMFNIHEVNFAPVSQVKDRPSFDSLTACYPDKRITLETAQENFATRLIDLIAPIGFGQRGLIVSPPKAGKTILLQNIANAITTNHPSAYLIVLLIDERPEEVTDMKRNVKAEVVSSTFDEPALRHVSVARIVLEKARRLVEQKIDVVILLDSITRLARAYNQVEPTSGKVLTGGVDANALHKPKRFFGAARNIEEGGSLTIIATALIETGSKMDEVIFEEFKGTGNMELVLARRIAERRIFPAMDLKKSGTRREELLLSPVELAKMYALRNAMGNLDETEAIELVLEKTKMTRSNEHFLAAMNSGS